MSKVKGPLIPEFWRGALKTWKSLNGRLDISSSKSLAHLIPIYKVEALNNRGATTLCNGIGKEIDFRTFGDVADR
jgi:hypothetical protein